MHGTSALKSQPPGYTFSTDRYEMFQVIVVSSGELHLTLEGSTPAHRRTLGPGGVAILRREGSFKLASPSTGYRGVCYLDFEATEEAFVGDPLSLLAGRWLRDLAELLEDALCRGDSSGNSGRSTPALLGEAMARRALAEANTEPAGDDGDDPPALSAVWAARVADVVHATIYFGAADFRERLAALPLSYRQLCRHFAREYGVSIGRYRSDARIAEAKRLLRSGGLSVTAVAHELRYPSSQKFAAQFRATTGCTPSEFRWALGHTGYTSGSS